jgi:ABC-2 type transport system ATP-binding protein
MSNTPLVDVHAVSRRYGAGLALADLSFTLARGQLLGLLGVNGAGKSTALKLLAGVLAPSSGTVRIAGFDLVEQPKAAARLMGYLPERPPLYRELTVLEYLRFALRLRGVHGARADQALSQAIERCELGDMRHRLIGALSKGYQQRVGLAQALAHAPDLLVLDEPTSGLDPVQANRFFDLIARIKPEHAIVLSTHHLPDAERCADRVLMLDGGRVRFVADIAELRARGESLEQRFLREALGVGGRAA